MSLQLGRLYVAIVPWAWRFWWWSRTRVSTLISWGPLHIEWARES